MKKCHLTYSYIFTPRVPQLLSSWGFDLIREPDENGFLVHDLWLQSTQGHFCSRFIEVIDERGLSTQDDLNDGPLWPGFAQNPPQAPAHLTPHFTLEGFLIEDHPVAHKHLSELQLPAPVYFEKRTTSLDRQLGYKKVSPYWALLIRASTTAQPPPPSDDASLVQWQGQPALWLHLETTCWDLILL